MFFAFPVFMSICIVLKGILLFKRGTIADKAVSSAVGGGKGRGEGECEGTERALASWEGMLGYRVSSVWSGVVWCSGTMVRCCSAGYQRIPGDKGRWLVSATQGDGGAVSGEWRTGQALGVVWGRASTLPRVDGDQASTLHLVSS